MRNTKGLAQYKDEVHNLGLDDLVSRLPDEVLVLILSKLPLKDAAITSKLSRRWRYLWCQTDCLDFVSNESLRLDANEVDLDAEADKFMSWVNHVIHQHKSPTIDKFTICSYLKENAKGAISKWIEFAISKDVQTLELLLWRDKRTLRKYCFPDEIFHKKRGFSLKGHSFNVPVKETYSLKSLHLHSVEIDDECLKNILSNCPVLEHLSIMGSSKLVKPVIRGKGLALKSLGMTFCDGLESVEICDLSIVFFECWDVPVAFKFDNLQMLQTVSISIISSLEKMNGLFCQISRGIPCLQLLELNLLQFWRIRHLCSSIEHLPFPKLQKLTQLIINGINLNENGLLLYPFLVEACPNLQRFTIEKHRYPYPESWKPDWEAKQMTKKTHQGLEVVEIIGYKEERGNDLELAMYFIQNYVALKKLVIKPFMKVTLAIDEMNAARNRVRQQLEPRIPVGVELVIL